MVAHDGILLGRQPGAPFGIGAGDGVGVGVHEDLLGLGGSLLDASYIRTNIGICYSDIQVRPACKWRRPALPVLTCRKYAALRFSDATQFGRFASVFDSGSA
ncbi:hypothetical protein MesoLj131a_11930 [Mesorhizobium sp. 131-2-1]|nr:hypothetical protein MesoLj131a_11930 [Mesorhizobium sp. 131-2-1]